MEFDIPVMDPVGMVRDYRSNYVNLYGLLQESTGVPDTVKLTTTDEQPILDLDLPAAMRDAMDEYQRAHGDAQLQAVKYLLMVNGVPELVVEDQQPMPAEEDLVTFSQTVSVLALDSVTVTSHQVVATKALKGKAV